MMRYAKEGVGEAIVDIVGSISNLTESRHNDKTMLANYGHIPATLETPQAIFDKTQEVKKEIADIGGREGMYMNGMLDAFATFARVLEGDDIKFADAIEVMQQVRPHDIPKDQQERLSASVSEQLGKKGYTGHVGEQIQAFLKDTVIEPEEVTKVADQFLENSKIATLKKVVVLPEGDKIESVNSIRNVFWSGYSRYLGGFHGDLTFNIDRPWSLPTFGNVLCHEGYPGHQAFYCHWDHLYQQGKLPLEAAYYSTAGNPANPMFEGSPEVGLHFLGWDDFNEDTPEITDEQKEIFALGRDIQDLQRMLQTQASFLANMHGASKEDVVQYMLSTGVYNRVEAENSSNFFTHPVQKYYYPAYYYGRWMIFEGYNRVPREKRSEFFHLLYDFPHTNETFIKEVGELIGDSTFDPLAKW